MEPPAAARLVLKAEPASAVGSDVDVIESGDETVRAKARWVNCAPGVVESVAWMVKR